MENQLMFFPLSSFSPVFTCSPRHAAPTQRQPPTRTTRVYHAVVQGLPTWVSPPRATHPPDWPPFGRVAAMGSATCWASTSVPCTMLCCVAIWPSCPNPCSTSIRLPSIRVPRPRVALARVHATSDCLIRWRSTRRSATCLIHIPIAPLPPRRAHSTRRPVAKPHQLPAI